MATHRHERGSCLHSSDVHALLSNPQVAGVIGADAKEIIFTSGATESNNLAIKGVGQFYKDKKNHIITTQVTSYTIRFIKLGSGVSAASTRTRRTR